MGIKNTTNFGPNCPQSDAANTAKGQEDCLYLNVFTPTTITSLLPVSVFIHGGGFTFGSGDTDLLGPETFVEENVLVVTINYRLGVLGFLNTGDRHSPGNFGLKDQILALRWIQENILAFELPRDFSIEPYLSLGLCSVTGPSITTQDKPLKILPGPCICTMKGMRI
jgi:carboxylesterase type B